MTCPLQSCTVGRNILLSCSMMEQLFYVVETVMSVWLQTSFLLVLSNLFMTFAWYVAALLSWGIALFEYLLQVPANRIGYGTLSLAQLKVLQEVITLSVFIPFALYYMQQPLKLDYLWAGLCLLGAVFFIFRN